MAMKQFPGFEKGPLCSIQWLWQVKEKKFLEMLYFLVFLRIYFFLENYNFCGNTVLSNPNINISIWSKDGAVIGTIILGQSGSGSNSNEGVLHTS